MLPKACYPRFVYQESLDNFTILYYTREGTIKFEIVEYKLWTFFQSGLAKNDMLLPFWRSPWEICAEVSATTFFAE